MNGFLKVLGKKSDTGKAVKEQSVFCFVLQTCLNLRCEGFGYRLCSRTQCSCIVILVVFPKHSVSKVFVFSSRIGIEGLFHSDYFVIDL